MALSASEAIVVALGLAGGEMPSRRKLSWAAYGLHRPKGGLKAQPEVRYGQHAFEEVKRRGWVGLVNNAVALTEQGWEKFLELVRQGKLESFLDVCREAMRRQGSLLIPAFGIWSDREEMKDVEAWLGRR